MIPVPRTEPGLTVSIKRNKAEQLVEGYRAYTEQDMIIYDVGDIEVRFYPKDYTTVVGPSGKVMEFLGA